VINPSKIDARIIDAKIKSMTLYRATMGTISAPNAQISKSAL
jgi:hypothetical protein